MCSIYAVTCKRLQTRGQPAAGNEENRVRVLLKNLWLSGPPPGTLSFWSLLVAVVRPPPGTLSFWSLLVSVVPSPSMGTLSFWSLLVAVFRPPLHGHPFVLVVVGRCFVLVAVGRCCPTPSMGAFSFWSLLVAVVSLKYFVGNGTNITKMILN